MPLKLERNAELNIYVLNGRPLDLTSFARAVVGHIDLLEARIRQLEEEAFTVVRATPEQESISIGLTPPSVAISAETVTIEPSAEPEKIFSTEPSPPAYKRAKKNKSKEQS